MSIAIEDASPPQPAFSPLAAFSGSIKPTTTGVLYTLGLAIVAFAMVLLPLIYLSLIVAVAWLVWLHLRHDTFLMGSGGGHASMLRVLVLYLGPAFVGGILIFFMIKPFFAAKPKPEEPLSLDPAKEPLLFAFVQKICGLVGAPVPCRIDVECEVNASARLKRGLWSNELILNIGLPLVSGLDMRQFAGVLAHEFGHFAQGAGMRFTYIIRRINFWFARVVYERDEWDMKLDDSARGADYRIGIVLHTARGCVWFTRRILGLLMRIGHGISCFMLRQMEYDADSYESKIAGSDAFEATAARLRVLHVATQSAYRSIEQTWASKRLPENIPLLIGHKAERLPPEVHEKLSTSAAQSKTGWFDTHPCDADRVRAARRLNEPGVFDLSAPAAELFGDFTRLSREVTRHEYRNKLELEFTDQNLMPADDILRESEAISTAEAMVEKFYGGVNISIKPLLTSAGLPAVTTLEVAVADGRTARDSSNALREEAKKISAQFAELQQKLIGFHTAGALVRAGFRLELGAFGLPPEATTLRDQETEARQGIEQTTAALAERSAALDPFMSALGERVTLALALGQAGPMRLSEERVEQLKQIVPLFVAVAAELPQIHELASCLQPFKALAQNIANSSHPSQVEKQGAEIMATMHRHISGIQQRLAAFAYPFAHALGKITVAEYLRNDSPMEGEWQRFYLESRVHVDRWSALHYRLLGQVLNAANEAEERFGFAKYQLATIEDRA